MKRYQILSKLGDGAYGSVLKAVHRRSSDIVAIKRMKSKYYSWSECCHLREVRSLRKLSHRNIVALRELFREKDTLFLVFEFMEQNVLELMKQRQQSAGKGFGDRTVSKILRECLSALAFMHRAGFFHRDIKPENLLVSRLGANDDDILCKVADFGLARETRSRPPFTDYVSTRWYRAPEVLLRAQKYGAAIDLWAMGAIMAELYSLRPLFPGQSEPDQLFKICSVLGAPTTASWPEGIELSQAMNFKFPAFAPTDFGTLLPSASKSALSFLNALLLYDPGRRPSAKKALRNHFLTRFGSENKGSCGNKMNAVSHYRPSQRLHSHSLSPQKASHSDVATASPLRQKQNALNRQAPKSKESEVLSLHSIQHQTHRLHQLKQSRASKPIRVRSHLESSGVSNSEQQNVYSQHKRSRSYLRDKADNFSASARNNRSLKTMGRTPNVSAPSSERQIKGKELEHDLLATNRLDAVSGTGAKLNRRYPAIPHPLGDSKNMFRFGRSPKRTHHSLLKNTKQLQHGDDTAKRGDRGNLFRRAGDNLLAV